MIRRSVTLALLLGVAAPAQAQAIAPGAVPVAGEEIVVTGRGLKDRPSDVAASVVTIDRARIESDAADRLESILADVAGLQQFRRSDSRSANPTSQGISLRGIGGNASSRALLILDGVPQADPFGGWVPFPAYATDRIGRIRVTRGGGSGYFGPGALAGTVELESATPSQSAGVQGNFAYGSRAALDARASAAFTNDGGFATLSGAYARGDGFVPIVAEDRGPADRRAPYEQASGAVRGVIRAGADTEVQANVSAFTDRRTRGTRFTANRSDGADASLRLVGRGRWGYSALAYLQTRAFASQFASIDAARTTATQTLDQYNTPATGMGARLELVPPLGAGTDLRLGVDWRAVDGRTQELYSYANGVPTRRRVAGGGSTTVGAFADASGTRGPLTLTLGGRIDRWSINGGFLSERAITAATVFSDSRFADRDGTEATGRAGAAYRLNDAITVRASGYRGWRLPTLNELYRPFRVGADATAASAVLRPERLTGLDAGVTVTPAARVDITATMFWNRLDDAIANVTVARGPGTFPGVGVVSAAGVYRVRQNLDAIRSTGLELDADWNVAGPIFARASWSHVSPRVEASGSAATLDGLRPAQTPRDAVSATIGWRRDGVAVSATLRHVARQFEDDANARTLAPATTIDGYLSLPLVRALALEIRAENVFDERVETGVSGADMVERATPRTLWIGIRYHPS
ncbi:TonB-dependent receptor [Sphingomonas sp. RHCKR47]|uniref:TonB-dependent receptor n=1 Tax=Sphingomonas citricola TaxID=2862498 RepID=UPI001CA4909D|nr:TonB-dependent receptor [Sphingomonas citricola]MBW6521961.1 TonB-dependent receptor [Sphingomonas citricola]